MGYARRSVREHKMAPKGREKCVFMEIPRNFPTGTVKPCLNVQIESVHNICRQKLSKVKLCDWPNKPDTTSWPVLNMTESNYYNRFGI